MSSHEEIDRVGQGPKPVVSADKAICSTGNEFVTDIALRVMKDGGNAVDAAIAASLAQPVLEPHLTNHGGAVSFLYWEAASEQFYQLNAIGAFVPGMPPFSPVPTGTGGYCPPGWHAASACIPGFMPGLKAIHERFATLEWPVLCEDAVRWANEGHRVTPFEYAVNSDYLPFISYFPEGREFYMPSGFLTPAGSLHRSEALAKTMRMLADEGPDHFVTGSWARSFVSTANRLGWDISIDDMAIAAPRWTQPVRYSHRDVEIVQLAPPERQAYFCAMVLGILLGLEEQYDPASEPEYVWRMAHALRWADKEVGYLHDPTVFDVPSDVWLDSQYHDYCARVIGGSRPHKDLSEHVQTVAGKARLAASGMTSGSNAQQYQPCGSCELAIIDEQGNWVQMMHTLQTGGIPGAVVGGVPMVGSHALHSAMDFSMAGWLVPGARPRCIIGNTFVVKENAPFLSLGTPGNAHCTVPQVLSNILDREMDYSAAVDAPRMLLLDDRYGLSIEDRVPRETIRYLASQGITTTALAPYDWHMGSFQMAWQDGKTGSLGACADPRRCGMAAGY